MRPINKKTRGWLLGGVLVVSALLIWWEYVYSPLKDRKDELQVEVSQLSQEHERLQLRAKKLSDAKQNKAAMQATLSQFSEQTVPGNSLEEVSAYTQSLVQEFLDNHELSLKAYKALAPTKWRDYPLDSVRFQLSTTTQGFADLLEILEKMEKAIRIEKLRLHYKRSKEHALHITLRLETLFVEGID